jgi:GDP-L-fucose synthase
MDMKKTYCITGMSGLVGKEMEIYFPDSIGSKGNLKDSSFDFLRQLCSQKPEVVIHLAASVGGIQKNINNNYEMYKSNMAINMNVLRTCADYSVPKVVCFLSTCIYPDSAENPLIESDIHNGEPHQSNFGYAYAKRQMDIFGRIISKTTETKVISVVPNNLYGKNDTYNPYDGHVIPSIICKVHKAKLRGENSITLWGDGTPLREFTYAGDIPKIIELILEKYDDYSEPINIGNTEEHSIREVAELICKIMEFDGEIKWDTSRPNGQMKKSSSNEKLLSLGWNKKDFTSLEKGLKNTIKWFQEHFPHVRGIEL